MNCQEVMELMQRELDHDLDDSEQAAMKAHLQQCPECAEMFVRLQRLSQELANLPKVTPPFSLVDSILPQLAEVDRAGEGPIAAAAVPAPKTEHANAPAAQLPSERSVRSRTMRRWATASGVVAAGLLMVLVINQLDGGMGKVADDTALMPQSAGSMSTTFSANGASSDGESAAEKRVTMSESAKTESMNGEGSAAPDTVVPKSGETQPNTSRSPTSASDAMQLPGAQQPETSPPIARPPSVPPQQPIAGLAPAQPPVASESQPIESQPPAGGGDSDAVGSKNMAPGSTGTSADSPGIAPVDPPAADIPPQTGSGSPSSADGGGAMAQGGAGSDGHPGMAPDEALTFVNPSAEGRESPPVKSAAPQEMDVADKNSGVEDAQRGASDTGVMEEQERAGFMALNPEVERLVSEDGLLVAALDRVNRRVAITTADSKQAEWFVSASWDEQQQPKLIGWKGSAELTYSLTDVDGKTTTIVIDIGNRTETIQKP